MQGRTGTQLYRVLRLPFNCKGAVLSEDLRRRSLLRPQSRHLWSYLRFALLLQLPTCQYSYRITKSTSCRHVSPDLSVAVAPAIAVLCDLTSGFISSDLVGADVGVKFLILNSLVVRLLLLLLLEYTANRTMPLRSSRYPSRRGRHMPGSCSQMATCALSSISCSVDLPHGQPGALSCEQYISLTSMLFAFLHYQQSQVRLFSQDRLHLHRSSLPRRGTDVLHHNPEARQGRLQLWFGWVREAEPK